MKRYPLQERRPFQELWDLHKVLMDKWFDLPLFREDFFERKVSMAVDVYEEKDKIVVKAEVPGIEKEDIDLHLSNNLLTIRGEKKREEETKKDNYYYVERSYGRFERTIELPCEVEEEKVKASYRNGVLTITLPKKAIEEKQKRIPIE